MTDSPPTWSQRLFVMLQQALPQHALSQLMHGIARVRWRPFKSLLIRAFARIYQIDMTQAQNPELSAYPHFNAFFTRALRPDARPLDPDLSAILCPVDGQISQLGRIEAGRLIQAKGHQYDVADLLGGDPATAQPFQDGYFITIYLSPRDYHRIHMPLDGQLTAMTYAPGDLFSVNAATVAQIPNLFARNERVIAHFDTPAGAMALTLVGAIFVGGIETVWAGPITPPHSGRAIQHWDYRQEAQATSLARGVEMGRFNLGSTVVLLFPPGRMRWEPNLAPGQSVRLGQRLGLVSAQD